DARTRLTYASTRPPAAAIFAVMSVQAAPSLRVTCTLPSAVPAQITPFVTGDSEIDEIANQGMPPGTLPSDSRMIFAVSFVLRSGLISVQWSPRSVDRSSTWPPV